MQLRLRLGIVTVGIALQFGVFGQGPNGPLSLAEALAWGVDNNLAVAGQRLNVEVAARNNNWVTAGRAPVIQATLGINNSINSQDNPASFINGSFYNGNATAGLLANYTLFNGYRVRFDRRRLGQLETQANQQVKQLLETSIFSVAQAYYNAQLQQAQLVNDRRRFDVSRDRVAFQQLRREYGQGSALELLQARSSYLSDSITVEQQLLEEENSRRALYLALDAEPARFAERPLGDTLIFEPRNWRQAEVNARLDSSATLQLLRTNEQLALTQTELARAAMKPVIALEAGLTHTRTAFKLNGEDPRTMLPGELLFGSTGQGLLGIQAAYTLYDAGARKRTIANAIVNERVSFLDLRNARQDATLESQTLLATYLNQQAQLRLQDALIANAQANLSLAKEQLRAGTINSFDYRDLQLSYFNAVQAKILLTHNILITDLNLRRLTGELVQ